jgi:hypothetical protein
LIHTVLDNYATHKHPKVLAWLARHPRRTFHFTPTSASWLNAVENFFSKMTRQRIRRGVFRSVVVWIGNPFCATTTTRIGMRGYEALTPLSFSSYFDDGGSFALSRKSVDSKPRSAWAEWAMVEPCKT